MEPILTILPALAFRKCGCAACEASNALVRFDSSSRCHSRSVYSSGRFLMLMPALFTRMPSPPSWRAASSTMPRHAFSSVMSAAMAMAPSFFAAAAFLAPSRPAMATWAPARANPSAMPSPMPPLPPVTSAVLPLRSKRSMAWIMDYLTKASISADDGAYVAYRCRPALQPLLHAAHRRAAGALPRQPVPAAAGARALRARPARLLHGERARRRSRPRPRLPQPPAAGIEAARAHRRRALGAGRAPRAPFAHAEGPQGLRHARRCVAARHRGDALAAAGAASRAGSAGAADCARDPRGSWQRRGHAARPSPGRHGLGGRAARRALPA